jgi:hypothetical protein
MKVIATLAVLILMVTGCSKLTPENYAKLKVGMSYSEVTTILGSPTSCSDLVGLKGCRWGDDKRHVEVRFAGDAVLLYSAQNIQ